MEVDNNSRFVCPTKAKQLSKDWIGPHANHVTTFLTLFRARPLKGAHNWNRQWQNVIERYNHRKAVLQRFWSTNVPKFVIFYLLSLYSVMSNDRNNKKYICINTIQT